MSKNIRELLNNIKTAVFGKDVRQSIHDCIEIINDKTDKGIDKQNEVISDIDSRQSILEMKYNDQIKNMALAEPQNAEIVAARLGFDTLEKSIKQKEYYFNNIEEMKRCMNLVPEDCIKTLGYYKANDGGGSAYRIRAKVSSDIDNGGSVIELDNGFIAELIIEDCKVNIKQFGAKGDGITDDTEPFINAINTYIATIFVPTGKYLITSELSLDKKNLIGEGASLQNNFKYDWENDLKHNSTLIFDFKNTNENFALTLKSYHSRLKNIIVKNNSDTKNGCKIQGDFADVENVYIIGFLNENFTVDKSYFGYFKNITLDSGNNTCNIGFKTIGYKESAYYSTGCTFCNIMVRASFNKCFYISGILHQFTNLFVQNNKGENQLYFYDAIGVKVNGVYMEDMHTDTTKCLFIDKTCMSSSIDNIYLSSSIKGEWINNGINCSYEILKSGVDYNGRYRLHNFINYFKGPFYVDKSGALKNHNPNISLWNTSTGNIAVNNEQSITINKDGDKDISLNFDITIDYLKNKTFVCMCNIETDNQENSFDMVIASESAGHLIGSGTLCCFNQNISDKTRYNFNIKPTLVEGSSYTISNIGIYVIEDEGGYVYPTINSNGDEMYGNLKFIKGSPIIKDSTNDRYYKIVLKNGELSVEQI